jgi:radical SAM protein with 4Fe4S-binding SPASM domain
MLAVSTTATPSTRTRNAELNADEYRLRKLVLRSRPTMVYIELTQNCNLSCLMCRSANTFDRSKNMSDALFERTIEELAPTATWVDLRGWGESTILPDFTAKLRVTAATGVRVRLVTNGLLIAPEHFELICGTDGAIAISVDAASPDLFAQLGRGDLHRVIDNVRAGTAVARRIGRGDVYFNTVVSQFNLHELPAIVELARSIGIERVVMSPIKTWSGHTVGLEDVPGPLQEAIGRATATANAHGMTLQLGAALHPSQTVAEALPSTCASPWSHALIDYEGRLIFCDHLISKRDYAMGNVASNDFESVWNGEVFQSLRRMHVEAEHSRRLPMAYQKCTWCYSNRYKDAEAPPLADEMRREVSNRATGARRLL